MIASLTQLAYGVSADATDNYVKIGESTAIKALKNFTRHIIELYQPEYLRPPNSAELECILKEYKARGFPGCRGSIDGMHWYWKNCPGGWSGQFTGKEASPTIVLEGAVSKNLRFWHAYFGMPGANNDLNVLHASPVFDNYLEGRIQPSSAISLSFINVFLFYHHRSRR